MITLQEYENKQVIYDRIDSMIDVEAENLLKGAYNPTIAGNIHEFLCEMTTEQCERIGIAIAENRFEDVGVMIAIWNREYHTEMAYDVAESNVMRQVK
jgi:hypothetical protein